jgi:putative acetyltransferase
VSVLIRAARRPDDDAQILGVVGAAFADDTRDAGEELAIVRRTWDRCAAAWLVELVADESGAVVAHAMAAPGRLDGTACAVAGVAPVCVAPLHQGRGIGTALMEAIVAEAHARRWPLLVLLGDPAFYGRVGFSAAGPLGIHYAPVGPDSPHFLARPLGSATAPGHGEFTYCWEPL